MKGLSSDNRIANLLQLFRKNSTVTVSELAVLLDVSSRTVRNDLKQLRHELQGCASIESGQGRYSLHIYDEKRFHTACKKIYDADDFMNAPRSRLDYIFGRLMRAGEPLLTDELAYEMNIGRTTIVNDLKKLRAELAPYQLSIIGKTSKGLVLHGQESDIRHYVLDNNYSQLYREYPLDDEIKEIILDMFSSYSFEKSVQETFWQFMTLMLDRFLTGHFIGQLSDSFYRLTARPEFQIISQLLDQISAVLRVDFPAEEGLFVLLPIIGMRTPTDIQDVHAIVLDESTRPLMDKILRRIRTQMDITIRSGEFTEEFLYHLMFMINRLRFHVRLENPVLDELRDKYPLAWRMADTAAQVITEETGLKVTEDERGYLASYFGVFLEEYGTEPDKVFRVAVVCGTGRVTARLVAAQLKKVLSSAAELTLFADEKVTQEVLSRYDIVLTTVDLSCPCDRPVIRICEVFNEQELRHKIEKAKYWDQIDVPVLDNNWFVMASLLDESRFFVLNSAEDYDSAVEEMTKSLAESGQVDDGFILRLREREKKGTMVFDHAVAIPHSVQYVWDKLVLAIGVFPKPLRHNGSEIRVIFLMGLPEQLTEDDSLLIRLYDEIISITQDTGLLDKIASADSFQALLRALYRQAS